VHVDGDTCALLWLGSIAERYTQFTRWSKLRAHVVHMYIEYVCFMFASSWKGGISGQCANAFIICSASYYLHDRKLYTPFTRSCKHRAIIYVSWTSQLVEPALSCKRGITVLHRSRWSIISPTCEQLVAVHSIQTTLS